MLPPGDWDQKTLLPVMDMARKRAKIRRKKIKKQEELEGLYERVGKNVGRDQHFSTQSKILTTVTNKTFENIMGKGENAGYQYSLLFP